MKHILNDISQEEKNRILEQHSGGKTIDTTKFKRLLESTLGNVKPLISETENTEGVIVRDVTNQNTTQTTTAASPTNQNTPAGRYAAAGYKQVADINLPNGIYIGNPDGYANAANQDNLFFNSDLHIYDKAQNKPTGYAISLNTASRSGYENVDVEITDKQPNYEGTFYFKNLGYTPSQTTGQN